MSSSVPVGVAEVHPSVLEKIYALSEEGQDIWHRFDAEVRQDHFHPFVPADYSRVQAALVALRAPGLKFLEWGSATGVITIMADLLGFEAYGIECDAQLVEVARELARKFGSNARFAAGSFLPTGYAWRPRDGDGRLGTIGEGSSGYLELGHPLEDFDLVYGYPWGGEEPMMHDLMRCYGGRAARLLIHGTSGGVQVYRDGRLEP
ncbi:MAG: class I SAM-dependent methyltransferase [Gemmatimonadetes bacterium]|nr:class I SAM-dependent methyltransferase [Gemmatimonadota bacterium]